jgi:hypothetical protein
MTEIRVAPRVGVMRPPAGTAIARHPAGTAIARHLAGTSILLTGLLLASCSGKPRDAGSTLRVYAADLAGAAKVCDVPKVNPLAGGGSEVPMKMANDGGWCGIRVHQDGPKPFEVGLLIARPNHGSVLIHEVGDETRIDYTPDRGFAGRDAFSVKLIPGDAVVQVGVTVTPQPKVTGSAGS